MRTIRFALVALLFFAVLPVGRAHAQSPDMQSLFLGDRTCPDAPSGCTLANVVAEHRYLHVVIHDQPNSYQWQVAAGPDCDHLTVVASEDEIPDSGYLEVVIDLQGLTYPTEGCYVLRGEYGFSTTYYAAYLDDAAAPDSLTVYPGYIALDGRPDLPDLDVASIARAPSYPYDGTPSAPRQGQRVHFRATILNSGALPSGPFYYHWTLDGRALPAHYDAAPLSPGQSVVLSLPWAWDPAPHTVTLTVYPPEDEISRGNDSLSIRTDALALGFWVEQGAYTYFRAHQWTYCRQYACSESDSFEDWLQRQVSSWNSLFAAARDPELAPAGVADRVRVQKVVVVSDGALPLHGFAATNAPDLTDHSVDLEWGLPSRDIEHQMPLGHEGGFDINWAMIHELGHARYLGDLYRFDVPLSKDTSVKVTASDGLPAFNASTPLDPARPLVAYHGERTSLFLYQNKEADMMSCDCNHFYGTYDATVLNRIQGRRARCGNANPPCNLGEWFTEIPPVNRLRILKDTGEAVPDGTTVKLYFDTSTVYNGHAFDDADSLSVQTQNGTVELPANPFRVQGPAQVGHNLLLIEVVAGAIDSFCFEEPTDFNIAYWEGYRDPATPATYNLRVQPHPGNACGLQRPPALVNEPFATSPYTSAIELSTSKNGLRVRVTLVDGAAVADPMRARDLAFRDRAGRIIARAKTGKNGVATATMRKTDPPVDVLDVTDQNLTIPVRPVPAARSSVQPP